MFGMNGYKILKCFRKEKRVSGELPCQATGLIGFVMRRLSFAIRFGFREVLVTNFVRQSKVWFGIAPKWPECPATKIT